MYKPEWLSEPAEKLLLDWAEPREPYDVIIVGSGYGGAVAAARLVRRARKDAQDRLHPLTVCVLERGLEHVAGTFPNSFSELPGHVRFSRFDDPAPKGVREGLFDLRVGKDVHVLVANGLGGGSLINAGVAAEPFPDSFDERWPVALRRQWNGELPIDNYLSEARQELGARPADTADVSKHRHFLDFTRGFDAEKAAITVNDQCVKCGDCATGCNVGAKVTLSSNYLRRARKFGAAIYTGVTVSHVEKRADRWAVFVAPTSETRPLRKDNLREIHARTVILSAGSFGSTEILMRSKARCRELVLSDCLGRRFSTNGDMINAVYRRQAGVNAAPQESAPLDTRFVGPTITGIARDRERRIVIEEMAIPGALRRVFEEVLTTTAMLEKFGRRDKKHHRVRSRHDPIFGGGPHPDPGRLDPAAVDPDLVEGCQVFAAMGDDRAKGRLEMVPGWDAPEHRTRDGALRVDWPNAGREEIFERQDELFRERAGKRWTYLPNPLWQPLPAGIAKALSGAKPAGMLFSVHPLGGCPMGDSADKGVVDHMGRVFDPASEFHEGLLVLDGSIVPAALGVNPLLTITALAERAVELYAAVRGWVASKRPAGHVPARPQVAHRTKPQSVTALRFAERMTGVLALGGGRLETELTLQFDPVPDLADFLRQPLHPLPVRGTVRIRDAAAGAPVAGEVQLLVRGASTSQGRIVAALLSYWSARGWADLFGYLFGWLQRCWTGTLEKSGAKARSRDIGRTLRVVLKALWRRRWAEAAIAALDSCEFTRRYVDLASNVGEIRYLFYEFTLQNPLTDKAGRELLPVNAVLRGRKTLQYKVGGNPWRQLTELDVTVDRRDGTPPAAAGTLSVDPAYFFRGFASQLQIAAQRDLPAAWMDLASLGLFIARILLKIHFWSFRLPDYQKYDPRRDVRRLPGPLAGLRMERHMVGYPETPRDAGVFLPVTRYRQYMDGAPPVLLIHGLGSGGIQFATDRVSPNLVQCLASWGFDVWVAELRTSIALPYSLDQWTLDEVARKDVPRIVDLVLDKTGARQLDVVAHCIGSAMFCTAVLDGKLQHTSGQSKVRRAVLLQVGPLVTLSKGTRLRTLAAAPLARLLPAGHLDFSVDDRASWLESAIDRLLNTYPYPADEAKHHRLRPWGRHNRHIANCNRWAAIDGLMIRHENLTAKMLDGLGEVLGHANLTTWTQTVQYGFLERLTDSEARNAYVTAQNVREYFRFPVRFLHGSDNDVFDPLTSWRSQELLRRIHGSAFPAEVQILPRYRHLDPLIGKSAEHDVFPYVAGFLMRPHRPYEAAPQTQDEHYYFRRPLIGPVLGWVRRHRRTGLWTARIWCRLDDLRSPVSFALVSVIDAHGNLRSRRITCPTDPSPGDTLTSLVAGPLDTLLCLDVELGGEQGRYTVVVLSAHEALAEQTTREHHQAELSAGKRLSAPRPHLSRVKGDPALDQMLDDPQRIRAIRNQASARAPGDGSSEDKIDSALITLPSEKDDGKAVMFALASCRYPGWVFDRERADATFRLVGKEVRKHPQGALSALFLVGDQIYADATAGAFDPKDRRERFYEAYREAWTAERARSVLSRLPTYMMMDDHEAGNDWHPEDHLGEDERAMREQGIEAFRHYQWLHSPGNDGRPKAVPPRRDAYWYRFKLHGFPVFVCDTRGGRAGRTRMLDDAQFAALKTWLRDSGQKHGERPKFVVSSSVVVPFLRGSLRAQESDGWDGFSAQLHELFALISAGEIQNVVFLCGDSHLSNCTVLEISDANRVVANAFCIVGSPMYAPYPFANATRQEFLEDNCSTPLELPNHRVMRYQVVPNSWVESDSFTLVRVAANRLEVAIGGAPRASFTLDQRTRICAPQPVAATARTAQELTVPAK